MKEQEFSSIINQINSLLLSCNTLMCNSGAMDNAEKKYQFYLMKIKSDNYKSGFYYAVRYKDPETNNWIPTKKSTDTDDELLAKSFAIENREAIIQEYKERRNKRKKQTKGNDFYKMLKDYYLEDSKYLKDDAVNNKREIVKSQRIKFTGFINTYLIPYLQQNKINSIEDITKSIYSGLKVFLQCQLSSKTNDNLSAKTINNYLIAFNRILQYHERNDLISKLPYSKGTGLVKNTKENKEKSKKPVILPTDKLSGIFSDIHFGELNDTTFFYSILTTFGLLTGMRDSEIGRLKREDIKYIKSENSYYVKVQNHKTDYHNTNETDEYRKIPIHHYLVDMLKLYIQIMKKEKSDYLFGIPKFNEDTKKIDGYLDPRKFRKAIVDFYSRIKIKERIQETGNLIEAFKIDKNEIENEMKEKNIVFYSLRHTFETLLATKYKGQTLLIDYMMGHKPIRAMLANYLHINEIDEETFWNEYGKLIIEFQNQFIPNSNLKLKEYLKKYLTAKFEENKNLINKDGTVSIETAFDMIKPLLISNRKNDNIINDDDLFDSV